MKILPVLGLLILFNGCANGLFYHPDRHIRALPSERGLDFEAVEFASTDGTTLHGWWLPAQTEPRGIVIHFHGNAQNISTHVRFAEWLPANGYHLFVFDYRGFGLSGSAPTRRGIVRDSLAALRYVAARPETAPNTLFIWGQSLGGTAALNALAQSDVEVRAVLIDSTYFSHAAIASEKMAGLPLFLQPLRLLRPLFVSSGLDAETAIRHLEVPVAFLHGEADRIVPHHHSQTLHKLAPNPGPLWIIPEADHCDAVLRFPETVQPLILSFFADPD